VRQFSEPENGLRAYVVAMLLVAASTLVGMAISPRWGNAAVDLAYLPAVLVMAVFAGRGPAFAAALASPLAYNYFFTEPYHTFWIRSPADVFSVAMLFAVAAVTSHLAASVRSQAAIAQAHAARNATIAGLARQLISCTSHQEIAKVGVEQLADLFHCNAALLMGTPTPAVIAASMPSLSLTPTDSAAAAVVLSTGEATGRGLTRVSTIEWQLHPVRATSTTIAVVALARDDGSPPVLSSGFPLLVNLLDQIALALERARLDAEARDFSKLRERDRLRSTLLSSIGEDLRPPLAAIATALGQLRRSGSADRTITTAISSEVAKLQRYLANLLDIEAETDEQPLEIGGLRIDLFNRQVFRDGHQIHLSPKEYAVLAELAKYPGRVLSHAHLMRTAWGPAQERQTEYLRVAIRALRQKLERDPAAPKVIVNEPAIGYRLAG